LPNILAYVIELNASFAIADSASGKAFFKTSTVYLPVYSGDLQIVGSANLNFPFKTSLA
jgi:hypothetical protein